MAIDADAVSAMTIVRLLGCANPSDQGSTGPTIRTSARVTTDVSDYVADYSGSSTSAVVVSRPLDDKTVITWLSPSRVWQQSANGRCHTRLVTGD